MNKPQSPENSKDTSYPNTVFGQALGDLPKEKIKELIKSEPVEAEPEKAKYVSPEKAAEKLLQALGFDEKKLHTEGINYWHDELKQYRRSMMELWPGGFVLRGSRPTLDEKTQKYKIRNNSNLDGNASLFFLKYILGFNKEAGQEEREYVEKVRYVFPGEYIPGAINLDTSWGEEHGSVCDKGALVIDHHSKNSTKEECVFQILYEQFRKDGLLDKIIFDPAEKQSLASLAKFVTAVDNYNIPREQSWKELWDTSPYNLFALCLNHQYSVKIEKIFEFFKTHSFNEAFQVREAKEMEKILGPAGTNKKKNNEPISFVKQQRGIKEKAKEFFEQRKGFTVFSPQYGKILVVLNEQLPGGMFACLGNGYDALLVWQPEKKSFFFNVRPEKTIPYSLYEDLGKDQAVWVRGAMLLQQDWRSQQKGLEKLNFSLMDLLAKLKVNSRVIPPYVRNKCIEVDENTKK